MTEKGAEPFCGRAARSLLAPAAFLTPQVCDQYFPELGKTAPKLLWLGVGKDDFLYQPAREFENYLKERKIDHRSLVTEGGHTWMNARHYLAETLQLFFQ